MRGTVRSTRDGAKTEVLRALGNTLPGNLELHEADLLKEGSFDNVVKGADYVFHTASPFFTTAEDPQRDLVSAAVLKLQLKLRSVPNSALHYRVCCVQPGAGG